MSTDERKRLQQTGDHDLIVELHVKFDTLATHEARISSLERWRAWMAGALAVIIALMGLVGPKVLAAALR